MMDVLAVCDGVAVELRRVHDSVFSQRLAGDGVAIKPTDSRFYAPVSGKIRLMFKGLHALVIETKEGLEYLIHIGINTVSLNGSGFKSHVLENQWVQQGDLLISVDEELFNKPTVDLTTLVLVMKPKLVRLEDVKTAGLCERQKTIMMKVIKKEEVL